jgi:hypothetical protein
MQCACRHSGHSTRQRCQIGHQASIGKEPTEVFDLNKWHRGILQVTGAMALKFNGATDDDVRRWAEMLRTVADEMQKSRSSDEK